MFPKLTKGNINQSPHVVILGAGASKATCLDGDLYGNKLPIMNEIVQTLNLEGVIKKYGFDTQINDFEAFFDSLTSSNTNNDLVQSIKLGIHSYFETIEIPEKVTIYDYLLLCLRDKDIIASFNWDPLLVQAYARNNHVAPLPRICFLHGNVAVGCCEEHRKVGYLHEPCNVCNNPMKAVPLMYPVRNKNYTDIPYLQSEWNTLRKYIQESYFFTIYGYSAPETDINARELLFEVWRQNNMLDFAQMEVIDIKTKSELEITWRDFIVRNNFGTETDFFDSHFSRYPRRSCDAFAMAQLQQMPWRSNPLPKFDKLSDLHAWIQPLLEEERNGYFSGNPCPLIRTEK